MFSNLGPVACCSKAIKAAMLSGKEILLGFGMPAKVGWGKRADTSSKASVFLQMGASDGYTLQTGLGKAGMEQQ